jgi:hypothetical protein
LLPSSRPFEAVLALAAALAVFFWLQMSFLLWGDNMAISDELSDESSEDITQCTASVSDPPNT